MLVFVFFGRSLSSNLDEDVDPCIQLTTKRAKANTKDRSRLLRRKASAEFEHEADEANSRVSNGSDRSAPSPSAHHPFGSSNASASQPKEASTTFFTAIAVNNGIGVDTKQLSLKYDLKNTKDAQLDTRKKARRGRPPKHSKRICLALPTGATVKCKKCHRVKTNPHRTTCETCKKRYLSPMHVLLFPLVWLFPLREGSMGAAWR